VITKQFVLAGDAIFTVEPPETFKAAMAQVGREFHDHYTYRVEKVDFDGPPTQNNSMYFVKALTGPDNTRDYVYLGVLVPSSGYVRLTRKSAFPETATRVQVVRRVLARIFAGEEAVIEEAGWSVHHEGRCGRCGRLLTVPQSVESGIGPECARIMAEKEPAPF
jgi:hypothetical protein